VKILEIHGKNGDSAIVIGEVLKNLDRYIPNRKVIVITDSNVMDHYLGDFPSCEFIEIGVGEGIKNLDTVKDIYERLVGLEADRSCFIVGIGGGVVCDIAGFAASTYLRGVRFGFVSTTLLSQVDASVGGKNGVNFKGYKNMVGVFSQPEFVICDMNLLKTLPSREIRCGLAEIVKHAAIGDADLLTYLEGHWKEALCLDVEVMESLVYESVLIKASIVNRDEREEGERRKLNFGHTFGHAIEKTTGILHGEAVSIGMVAALALSEKRGYLSAQERQRIEGLLMKLGLPTSIQFERGVVIDALRRDKKRDNGAIYCVVLRRIGEAFVEAIPLGELEMIVHSLGSGI